MSDPVSTPPPVGDNGDSRVHAGTPDRLAAPAPEAMGSAAIAYRPVSGFAIAGFAAACLFALLVLIVAVVALIKGAPFFYSPFILIIPGAGFVLSLVARSQIRASEGTRAGEPLARAGIWISLFTGLGYFVYYYVTGMAVTGQAHDFLMVSGPESGFFPHLEKASRSTIELNEAFLLTLPASNRADMRAADDDRVHRSFDAPYADGSPGQITMFTQLPLVHLFVTDTTGKLQVEALGVESWGYENNSYLVKRRCRVSTPEGIFEFLVPVRSSEGEAGEVRKWHVETSAVVMKNQALTPLGQGLFILRRESGEAIKRWVTGLSHGEAFDFAAIDQTDWAGLRLGDKDRDHMKKRIDAIFGDKGTKRHIALSLLPADTAGDWKIEKGKVQIGHQFNLPLEPQGTRLPVSTGGRIVVQTTKPIDPATELDPRNMPEWEIHSFQITRAAPVTGKKFAPK